MKYPKAFPFPTAWLKAMVLLIVAATTVGAANKIFFEPAKISSWEVGRPEPLILSCILIALSPIPVIAGMHYLVHSLLERFSPELQSKQAQKRPGLTSLWEAIYGWVVLWIPTLIVFALYCIFPALQPDLRNERSIPGLGLLWLTLAAYLYQIEYLARQK